MNGLRHTTKAVRTSWSGAVDAPERSSELPYPLVLGLLMQYIEEEISLAAQDVQTCFIHSAGMEHVSLPPVRMSGPTAKAIPLLVYMLA